MGQWGLKPSRKPGGPSYEDLVESEGRPRLRMWLERAQTEGLLQAAVVYGYFRCVSDGDDLIVLGDDGGERERFTFPRQQRDERLCLADYFRPASSGETDVVAFQLATMGSAVSGATAELFAANAYREYLELHGLSVQLTEALAEYWHARVRQELAHRQRGPGRPRRLLQRQVPGRALLDGLSRLPRPRRPGQDRPAARAGADRRRAVRGDAAASRAVHRRDRHPSPGRRVTSPSDRHR